MKKIIFFLPLISITVLAFGQDNAQRYDSSFRDWYKRIALHPGHVNRRGIIQDSVVRRWDKDIVIFVEGGTPGSRRAIRTKLKNTIEIITPSLDNKIRISFTDKKSTANYVIDLNCQEISGWYEKWDALDNIYSCELRINTTAIFNFDQQAALVSHYFLKTLGDFGYTPNTPMVVSNMRLWRQDINDMDLQILKLHYSDNIRPGMGKMEIDKFFSGHEN
jgi:hypothetical protein